PLALILMLSLAQGFFNSLQFTSLNSMAYADIDSADSSIASTIASPLQQMSMSFGLACGSLVVGCFLGDLRQSERVAVLRALHDAYLTVGGLAWPAALSSGTLRPHGGDSASLAARSLPRAAAVAVKSDETLAS